jgi:uncharacterized membrane protein (DUF2068 family)
VVNSVSLRIRCAGVGSKPPMPRPRPVSFLAVLACLLGASYLITAALLKSGKFPVDQMLAQMPNLGDIGRDEIIQTMTVLAAVFGVLGVIIGLGLLGMKNWARAAARVFAALFLLGALINMIQAFHDGAAAGFLIYAVIGGADYAVFWYLGRAQVRAAFARVPPAALPPAGSSPGA